MTIASDGILDTGGYSQTISGLTMSAGAVVSGAGTVTLTGSVTYALPPTGELDCLINGNLSLHGAHPPPST